MNFLFKASLLEYILLVFGVIGAFYSIIRPIVSKFWTWFIFEYIEWKGRQFKKKLDIYNQDIIKKINEINTSHDDKYLFINKRLDEMKEDIKEQNRTLIKFYLKNKD
jgi:hypothetical protein